MSKANPFHIPWSFIAIAGCCCFGIGANSQAAITQQSAASPNAEFTTSEKIESQITNWIFVRHAERDGEKDVLTEAGKERAKALKQIGKNLRVRAIYSTDFARTKQTVAPLADELGLEIQIYDPSDSSWMKEAATKHTGENILVVGHSNTTPQLVAELSGVTPKAIEHNQYDRLFLVQTSPSSRVSLEIPYGSVSTPKASNAAIMAPVIMTPAIGVGAKPIEGAELLLDGSRAMLDEKWTYWEGPRFSSSLPIKWKLVADPVDKGEAVMTFDPEANGGIYGAADIVTKEKFRDFQLHVEFLITAEGGNSGVYLQNRYEIQVLDGDKTTHGMAAVINEQAAPYEVYNGVGKWNAYDITFRAARFDGDKRTEKALVTMYFNGQKVHTNVPITRVWGGPNSGIDGDNDDEGNGIRDVPGGLKLQAEGHAVLYRNIWIKKLDIEKPNTDLQSEESATDAAIIPGR